MNKEYKTSEAQRKAVKKWTEEHEERKKELDRLHNIRRRERIKKEHQELMKLQNNWNELKKWLEECLNEIKQNDAYDRTSYEQGQIIALESSIAKVQELEQVKDE